jgi:glyoxylase-like metal-dependent hydrolase (beta-lactamase superfamily II)
LDLEVVWSPGHTPGLVCLYEPWRRLLFTTDHVMRRAPAPVSLRHNGAANPLDDYLRSIKKLKSLDVEAIMPGDGRPFVGLHQRAANIEAEIHEQLAQIIYRLASGPASAYDLLSLRALQDRRPIASRYQVSLVLARLRFLECLGKLHRTEIAETIQYGLTR